MAQGLERLDVLVENAGIAGYKFATVEDNESMITVNVISTSLLELLIPPKLRETAMKFGVRPGLSIVSSKVSFFAKFKERGDKEFSKSLNDNKEDMGDRSVFLPSTLLLFDDSSHSSDSPSPPPDI